MHFTKPFSLIFFATLASHIQVTSGECCGCPKGWLPPFTTGWCPDNTKCTPFCAYGSCNIFACNCDGGCRGSRRRRVTRSFAK
ncbi:hypothetical protein BD779DRAFT_784202 [Infundibulicybe gibba]|nr:hypothetical protein BD779DRAFT_784202 [Infundibulicybe gibba]